MKRTRSIFQFTRRAPFNSIKLRLPLSYAVIALLVALSLGTVLMGILSQYYSQQEVDYLRKNAKAISASLGQKLGGNIEPKDLQAQINLFAFLSRTDLRLIDSTGQQLAQSEPQTAIVDSQGPSLRFVTQNTIGPVAIVHREAALPDSATPTSGEATPAVEDRVFWITSEDKGNITYAVPPSRSKSTSIRSLGCLVLG